MICNICGKVIEGYGNNPSPLCDHDNERCCDECNGKYVIPARIALLQNTDRNFEVGDEISIIWMYEEPTALDYMFRTGVIKSIDSIGQLHGTWGGLAVDPSVDTIVKL